MAKAIRDLDSLLVDEAVAAVNALKCELAAGASKVHADVTCKDDDAGTALAVASANASDLPTALTLVADIKAIYALHIAEGTYGHKAADTTNTVAAAAATDLATAITLANEIKADYEAHRASTTFHYTADGTNTIAAVNATDLASIITLLNELKTDINAHILAAFTTRSIKVVAP